MYNYKIQCRHFDTCTCTCSALSKGKILLKIHVHVHYNDMECTNHFCRLLGLREAVRDSHTWHQQASPSSYRPLHQLPAPGVGAPASCGTLLLNWEMARNYLQSHKMWRLFTYIIY